MQLQFATVPQAEVYAFELGTTNRPSSVWNIIAHTYTLKNISHVMQNGWIYRDEILTCECMTHIFELYTTNANAWPTDCLTDWLMMVCPVFGVLWSFVSIEKIIYCIIIVPSLTCNMNILCIVGDSIILALNYTTNPRSGIHRF